MHETGVGIFHADLGQENVGSTGNVIKYLLILILMLDSL